jgi:hypothetical protein
MGSRQRTITSGLVGIAVLAAAFVVAGHGPSARLRPTRAAEAKLGSSSAPIHRVGTPGPLARGPNGSFGTSVTATNWAGYDVTGGGVTAVTASWYEPAAASISPAASDTAFWVGLDGDGSPTVEQIGTEAYVQDGSVSYDAWYEMYPAEMHAIENVTVSPGDEITATVTANGAGGFTLTLVDDTTQTSFTKTLSNGVKKPASAEVIAEAPTEALTGDLLPLVDFGTVDFSACAFNDQPVGDFDWNQIDMVGSDGTTTLAATSALGSDGASFSVSQPGIADTTPPTTAVQGAGGWHNEAVTLTFTAVHDNGSGVAFTEYELDSGPWTEGTTLTIAAPADHANDGPHTVDYYSTDYDGDTEPMRSCTVGIDTRPPKVVANWAATVRRGHTASLRYVVDDPRPGSPTATVTIRVVTLKGRLVKKLSASQVAVDTKLITRFVCNLAKGTYRFFVYATDAAGNPQTKIGSERLTVD